MSKQEIWELFYGADTAIRGRNILAVLVAALIIGFVIFITYRVTHLSTAYSAKINATNVAITLITAVIMLMISSNIVISLGMVGALSIIRFSTAIKDPWDTVYIFWAVVEGLAIGSQNFKLSFIAVIFIGMALILLSCHTTLLHRYLLVVRCASEAEPQEIQAVIASQHKHCKLRAANRSATSTELIFEVLVHKAFQISLISKLQAMPEIITVNFLEETGDTVG